MAPDLHLEAPEATRKNLPVSYFSWICILYNYTLSLTVFYIEEISFKNTKVLLPGL